MALQHKKSVAILFCLMAKFGCSSTASITSEPVSEVLELNPDYSVGANKGPGPVEVESQNNLERFEFSGAGRPPEYLLVLFPNKLEGELKIPLSEGSTKSETSIFGVYFDLLLRAHRMLLNGDLMGAENLINRIEHSYDEGYGTTVLKANLAVVRGKPTDAARHFEVANQLLPGNNPLSNLVPKPAGQEKSKN